MDAPSVSPLPRRRRRWPVIVLLVALVPTAVFGFIWFGLSPNVPAKPIRLVRDDDGRFVPANSPNTTPFASVEVQAAAIKANNNFTSSCVASGSDHATFACQRLMILNRSKHVLMARVGQVLLEELKPLGFVREIDYYPVGFAPEPGSLTPDVTISLNLDKLEESGWPGSHTVEATVTVTAGNAPPGCRNSYTDHLSPPIVEFDWSGQLQHRSSTMGVSSSAAKYKLVAENVAKQIADSLKKEFTDRREKEGAMPDLPEAFYPPYRETPSLPLAEVGRLEVVTSSHGLMNHNETMWRLATDRPIGEVLAELRRRLESSGWQVRDASETAGNEYLRMSLHDAVLTIYCPSPQRGAASSPPQEPALFIHYLDRMTQDEVRDAIDESLAKNVSEEILICFERHWSEEQSRRILKSLQSRPARTPEISLTLASLYHRVKEDDAARRELVRSVALLRTVAQTSELENRAQALAKELGDEQLVKQPVEVGVLEELGFIELKGGVQIPPQEIAVEEPVHFYAKMPDGSLKTISVRAVSGSVAGGEAYQLAHVESSEHGRSWGSGTAAYGLSVDDQCRATFSLEGPDAAGVFRLRTELSD